jgi:hypothetical protein
MSFHFAVIIEVSVDVTIEVIIDVVIDAIIKVIVAMYIIYSLQKKMVQKEKKILLTKFLFF